MRFAIRPECQWTTGGWLHDLNMRTNGYDFHMALTNGEIAWTDDRVHQTFAHWRALIDMGAFIDNSQSYDWQEALPFLAKGEAAAYLMGNFAVAPLREAGLSNDQRSTINDQPDFYQFPAINPDVELTDDAPTDTLHIPSGAENKEAAREFLRYDVPANVQSDINSGAKLSQLPVSAVSSVNNDEMLQQGFTLLSMNSPGGIAQLFDRDTAAEMAAIAMGGFQEFMVIPDNLNDVLSRLEQARQRIY